MMMLLQALPGLSAVKPFWFFRANSGDWASRRFRPFLDGPCHPGRQRRSALPLRLKQTSDPLAGFQPISKGVRCGTTHQSRAISRLAWLWIGRGVASEGVRVWGLTLGLSFLESLGGVLHRSLEIGRAHV